MSICPWVGAEEEQVGQGDAWKSFHTSHCAIETWRCWSELREGNGAGEGLEHKCDGAAEGPGGSAGEQELRGDLLISELPERSLEPGGVGLCSPGTSARSRGNGLRLRQGRLRLDLGTISSPKGCGALEQAAQGSAGVTSPGGLDRRT